jgi:hypothetical protein
MYLLKRYQIGVAVMLRCILSCSTTLFAQSKQAIQQYEAGLMALEKNEPKKAIQYFTTAAAKDSQYLDPIIALFQVHFENKNFQAAT